MIASVPGRILVMGAAGLGVLVSGCSPVPPPRPTEGQATPSPRIVSSSPGMTPEPSPIDPASVQIHLLDPEFIPATSATSANGQLLWAGGDHWASEIWHFSPGSAAPERLFVSPRPKPDITSVVASAGGYAFVEEDDPLGVASWNVWYLAGPGVEPVRLDHGTAREAGSPPTIAMDDRRVAWAGFDEPSTGFVTRIGMAEIADIEHPRTLLERPVDRSLFWYPALDGDELWYASIDPASDPTAEGPEYTLETLDLANPGAAPVLFPGSGHDFNPAVNDRFLVWKANRRGDAALNWGTLKILDRRSQLLRTIPGEDGNRPSIGDRFVTFEEITHATVPVYDTASHTLMDLASDRILGKPTMYGGESISGRLLTFFAQASDVLGAPRIAWAMLPE